jgi:hypothetical protein
MNKYDMIKVALKKNASNMLLVLQYSDYWDSVEQSLWFLIKVYISGYFSKEAMEKDQRHQDWYLMHDFPKLFPRELLKAALEKQDLLKISHPLSRLTKCIAPSQQSLAKCIASSQQSLTKCIASSQQSRQVYHILSADSPSVSYPIFMG